MEIDVSGWTVIRDEPGGRDPNKRWIATDADAPRDQHWLWKSRQTTGGGTDFALTDCAEVFVSRIAATLQLPSAECQFAISDGELGLISRNVTPLGFNLNTGTTYLPEVEGYERRELPGSADGRQKGRMRLDHGYTLEAVQQVLMDVSPPPGTTELSAFGYSRATSSWTRWLQTLIGTRATGRSSSARRTEGVSWHLLTITAALWVPG